MIDHYLDSPFPWSPCDLFKAGAIDTWERIRFSRNIPNLRIHETTITQNLIYEFRILQLAGKLKGFLVQEARDESTNGADILLYLVVGSKAIGFALQAKIIYHSSKNNLSDGNYRKMHYNVKKSGNFQVDLIIDYAFREKLIPMYLMYNYINANHLAFKEMRTYGCSLISAQFLKDNFSDSSGNLLKKISFQDLHSYPRSAVKPAFPWHELVCEKWAKDSRSILSYLGLDPSTEVSVLSVEELIRDDAFSDISDNLDLNMDQQRTSKLAREFTIEALPAFNPKFRFLVNVGDIEDRL